MERDIYYKAQKGFADESFWLVSDDASSFKSNTEVQGLRYPFWYHCVKQITHHKTHVDVNYILLLIAPWYVIYAYI